jgi:hypothetical protein
MSKPRDTGFNCYAIKMNETEGNYTLGRDVPRNEFRTQRKLDIFFYLFKCDRLRRIHVYVHTLLLTSPIMLLKYDEAYLSSTVRIGI